MKWPLELTCFLLTYSCIFGTSHACYEFPVQWNGHWYQSDFKQLVTFNGSMMSNRGRCVDINDDKFIVLDPDAKCYRCIIIHMKHLNVLQYKETFCAPEPLKPSLFTLCNELRSDAILFTLFRIGATSISCPFKGPLEFSYSHGDEECKAPLSALEECTQDTRMVLRYQSCPNIISSETSDMEVECVALWKDNSINNLVAKVKYPQKGGYEIYHKCFIYEQISNNSWNMGQSEDASCTDIIAVKDAQKTFKIKQKSFIGRCSYPSWVVSNKLWVALDPIAARLQASRYNLTIVDREETRLLCHSVVPLNNRYEHPNRLKQVQYVAKATLDCMTGYVCMMFYRRDNNIIELQLSEWSQTPGNACISATFDPYSTPYTTFITPDPTTRQCPKLGRYKIVSGLHNEDEDEVEDILSMDSEPMESIAEIQDVRVTSTPYPEQCRYQLDIGCKTPDHMEFITSCNDEIPPEYSCHGTWIENDMTYLVASTEKGRYCLIYSTTTAATGSRELLVTGHLASCPRTSYHQVVSWQMNLTFYEHCGISIATSWTFRISASVYILAVLGILSSRYIAR